MSGTAETLAGRLTEAFGTSNLALLGELLSPDVRWGGEEETPETCHSRSDVLAWYGRLNASGLRAQVTETIVRVQAVVLGLDVSGPERGPDGERPNQVFRIADGLVVDIRGYPQRAVALQVADTPVPAQG
ncbi:nuclear transport factor 2 family protein [Streptacidiphilus anmyonensis]|uniref:nuclear transport factor 2 family protein n=1 Tax=Streptacidiphilus anmyonensis TaxID=405782 RepID=UPI0005A8BBF8|nr:nuclear transport factor 2 family protein [Streptacidiphilus anmyonensis]